jgi:hypothetical protein
VLLPEAQPLVTETEPKPKQRQKRKAMWMMTVPPLRMPPMKRRGMSAAYWRAAFALT